MSSGATNKKWYEKTGLVTGIGVVIGIVIGLVRNDLPFGIVTGFFLGLGVVVGAVGSKWYKRRGAGSDNDLTIAIVLAVGVGIVAAILTSAIGGILDQVNELVKVLLNIALDQASSLVWGIAIGIGALVGAGLRSVLGEKDKSGG